MQANGKILSLRTTDAKLPVAAMLQPLDGPLDEGTLVEVIGTVENPTKISCHDLYVFPREMAEGFDADMYDEYLAVKQEFPELSQIDPADHFGVGGIEDPTLYEMEEWMKNMETGDGMSPEEEADQAAFFNQL